MQSNEEIRLRALMLKGLDGDAGAHRAFLEGVAALLRGYFRRRAADPAEAEDLLQETLIAIHTRRTSYDPKYPVTAWIHAIARYRLIDAWRRKKRRGVSVPIENAWELHDTPDDNEVDARLDAATLLEKLPAKQRESIRLVKLEEKSVREASAITGWGESDIKVSIHRGLKALAKMMREETA
ncbi:MAG: sigma-70 family RNA polymerase sigma factor [Caulobacterales bacterium]